MMADRERRVLQLRGKPERGWQYYVTIERDGRVVVERAQYGRDWSIKRSETMLDTG